MKKLLSILLAIALVAALFGCSSGGGDAEAEPAEEAAEESTEEVAEEPAETGGTLVIYNSNTDDWTDPILADFTAKTGIQVEIISGGSSELMSRVISEADNPQGDVYWGGTIDTLAASADYLEPYQSTEYDAIIEAFRDPEYRWYPDTVDPFVIAYNTDRVTADEAPTGWNDVIDEKWKGEIGMADPAQSGSAYTVICTMLTAWGKGDTGYANLEAFVKNLDGRLASGSSAMIQAVVDGEYKMGLTFEEAVLKYKDSGSPLEIVYPEDGTTILAGGIAIIGGAKNKENAQLFLDYVLSLENQSRYAEFNRRSCRNDIELPEGTSMCPIADIPQNDFDLEWCTGDKEDILAHWDEYVDAYMN